MSFDPNPNNRRSSNNNRNNRNNNYNNNNYNNQYNNNPYNNPPPAPPSFNRRGSAPVAPDGLGGTGPTPPIQLIVRDKQGWRLYSQTPKTGVLRQETTNRQCIDANIIFSDDGSYFAVLIETGIEIYDSYSTRRILFLPQPKVRHVYFSPLNNYLVSYHHRKHADKTGNCWVWRLNFNNISSTTTPTEAKQDFDGQNGSKQNIDNSVIYTFFLAEFNPSQVPFAFSNDEIIAVRAGKGGILIHDLPHLQYQSNNVLCKIDIPKIDCANIAPVPVNLDLNGNRLSNQNNVPKFYYIATFALGVKNKAANVNIYQFDYSSCSKTKMPYNVVVSQALMGVDNCALLWNNYDYSSMISNDTNNNSTNQQSRGGIRRLKYTPMLLALASADVDVSGQSYYGHQTLWLLNPGMQQTKKIPISDKGKLQCAKWHPNGRFFFIIDNHPMELSQYTLFGNLVKNYGQLPRNDIVFSRGHTNPGRFMFLAGFGNLNGEMSFYDCDFEQNNNNNKNNNQKNLIKQIGYNKDESCRYYDWSPNGESVICARLFPYRNVDNGFRIYKYNGSKLFDFQTERLYQVIYRPNISVLNVYPKRAPSPNSIKVGMNLNKMQKEKVSKRYIPPHMRGKIKEIQEQENNEAEQERQRQKKRKEAERKKRQKQRKAEEARLAMEQAEREAAANNANNGGDSDDEELFVIEYSDDNNDNGNDNNEVQGSNDNNSAQGSGGKKRKRNKKNKKRDSKPGLNEDDNRQWARGAKMGQQQQNQEQQDEDDNGNDNGQNNGGSGGKKRKRKKKNKGGSDSVDVDGNDNE